MPTTTLCRKARPRPSDHPPGVQPPEVQAELQKLVGPRRRGAGTHQIGQPTPASPLRPDVVAAVTMTSTRWSARTCASTRRVTGVSDGSFFRAQGMPVYDMDGMGISPIHERAHGLQE